MVNIGLTKSGCSYGNQKQYVLGSDRSAAETKTNRAGKPKRPVAPYTEETKIHPWQADRLVLLQRHVCWCVLSSLNTGIQRRQRIPMPLPVQPHQIVSSCNCCSPEPELSTAAPPTLPAASGPGPTVVLPPTLPYCSCAAAAAAARLGATPYRQQKPAASAVAGCWVASAPATG